MGLVSNPKDGDDVSVRQAIAKLGSTKLGVMSTPTFLGVTTTTLTISGLTTDSLVYPVSGLLTSLGVAANGQIPIGSTGTTPVLATITQGSANQVRVANAAGSITLSLPQNIHTGASPTFAGLTVTNCVVLGSNSAVFKPNADAVDFFQIKNATGDVFFNADTTNKRIEIGTNASDGYLHVVGTSYPLSRYTRVVSGNAFYSTVDFQAISTAASITDDFGVNFGFTIGDSGGTNIVARFGVLRDGADNSGKFVIDTYKEGARQSTVIDKNGYLGIGLVGTTSPDGALHVSSANYPVTRLVRTPSGNDFYAIADFGAISRQASITDDFGVNFGLRIGDTGSTQTVARFGVMRDGADNSGKFVVDTYNSGTPTTRFVIDKNGNVGFSEPDPETFLELTHAQPYITTQCSTHINNLGRISQWIAKGNKLDETEHTLGIVEWGHDGTGNDTKGYFRVGTNANGGVDTIVYPFKIDGAQITHIGDGTNEVQINATGVVSLNGLAGLQLPHMMQSDSTNQTVSSANVAQVVTFNTDVHHFGITRTTSSRFTILKEASYLIAISALCDTTVANKDIEVWLRINGNDVANSNTIVHLGTAAETTLAVTYIKHFDVGDYFEFWMTGENTGCRLLATAAVTTGGEERPACPSIIMTCNYIGVD